MTDNNHELISTSRVVNSLSLSATDRLMAARATPNPPADQDKPVDNWKDINTTNYRMGFMRSPVLYWGALNDYPQILSGVMAKTNVLEAGLGVLADIFMGRGLFMYKEVFTKGVRSVEEIEMPAEITEAFMRSNINEYIDMATREILRWGNIFPLYFMDRKRNIAQVRMFDTVWNRLERPNPDSGTIDNIYVSAQWGLNNFVVSNPKLDPKLAEWVQKYPLVDNFDAATQMKLGFGSYTFAQHIKIPVSGLHYGRVPWHAAYENGWVNISSAVPEMKAAIFKNSLTIPYKISIHKDYWTSQYTPEGWAGFTVAERSAKIKAKQKEIEETLIGANNQGKSIFSSMNTDVNGNVVYTIMIEAIDNKLKDGVLIPDAQGADSQIMFSLALDPGLMGLVVPGATGGQSAGSGSNIREALLAASARSYPIRQKVLTPLYVWSQYAGWQKKYGPFKFGLRDFIINTLDKAAPAAGQDVTTE